MSKKFFSHQIEPGTARLFCCFEAFLPKLKTNCHLCPKKIFSSISAKYRYSKLFYCIEVFLQKLTKKLVI